MIPVRKAYSSQAQRNYFEMCRNEGGEGCPDKKTLDEFHAKSKGHMTNKQLPRRAKAKKTIAL